MTTKDSLVRAVAELVAGLHVPVSMGLPLGTARQAYSDVRDVLGGIGYPSADEVEERIRRILDTEAAR